MDPGRGKKIVKELKDTEGWLLSDAAELFGALDECQRRAGVEGGLFEIGVHHGKSAAVLGAMLRPDEHLGACDIFDQDNNPSQSGAGDRVAFEATMRRFGHDVEIHAKPSSELAPEELGGPFRFFHIDGGHHASEALADLELGAKVVGEGGVIVLDDPWSILWPGVTEGVLNFLNRYDDWAPLLLGFNKFVLVRKSDRAIYEHLLTNELISNWISPRAYTSQTQPIAGQDTTIFYIPADRSLPPEAAALIGRVLNMKNAVRRRLGSRGRS